MNDLIDRPSPSDSPDVYRFALRVPPEAQYAATARGALAGFCRLHGVSPDDLANLTFALGEAVANAIEYGSAAAEVEIHCEIEAARIVTHVIDRGSGFAFDGQVTLPGLLAEGGRGIPLMRLCSDFLSIVALPEGGTQVSFGRNRAAAAGEREA